MLSVLHATVLDGRKKDGNVWDGLRIMPSYQMQHFRVNAFMYSDNRISRH